MRNPLLVCMLCVLIGWISSACKEKKTIDQMSDQEKVNYLLDDDLTADEKHRQIQARQAIVDRMNETKAADLALNEAMDEARKLLPDPAYANLEKAQNLWQHKGRGKDINQLVAHGIPAAEAYAKASHQRAEWISIRTSWALLIDMPGKIGGLYHTDDDRILEIYEMPNHQINMVLRFQKRAIIVTATGSFEDGHALLHTDNDNTPIFKLIPTENGDLILLTAKTPDSSQSARSFNMAEGNYQRYNPGEIDVFAP